MCCSWLNDRQKKKNCILLCLDDNDDDDKRQRNNCVHDVGVDISFVCAFMLYTINQLIKEKAV
jgi:hypothetical protein